MGFLRLAALMWLWVVMCPAQALPSEAAPDDAESLRVVLSWATANQDLDAHLMYPGHHLYFASPQAPDAQWQGDSQSASETLRVAPLRAGESYLYAVHDFTHSSNLSSYQLARSQAKVEVYRGTALLRSYSVPQNREGNLWTVFRLTGSGELQDINGFSSVAVEPEAVFDELTPLLDEQVAVESLVKSAAPVLNAKTLNQQGEAAYRAGTFSTAMQLYRQAIELDEHYAQAYSNLALAAHKDGRIGDALEADRQAIALAHGPSAASVRASAYYDMGRIYEEAGQWSKALEQYQRAREQKLNPVYDNAIERMKNR